MKNFLEIAKYGFIVVWLIITSMMIGHQILTDQTVHIYLWIGSAIMVVFIQGVIVFYAFAYRSGFVAGVEDEQKLHKDPR